MSTGEELYLGLVIGGMTVFALVLGYQSLREWFWLKRGKR